MHFTNDVRLVLLEVLWSQYMTAPRPASGNGSSTRSICYHHIIYSSTVYVRDHIEQSYVVHSAVQLFTTHLITSLSAVACSCWQGTHHRKMWSIDIHWTEWNHNDFPVTSIRWQFSPPEQHSHFHERFICIHNQEKYLNIFLIWGRTQIQMQLDNATVWGGPVGICGMFLRAP